MSNLKEKIKDAQIDLIKELGIDKLEPEQREKIIMDIGEILQQKVVIRVVEELPDEKQDEFKEILDKGEENPELIDEFLKKNVPDIENMILEEISEYKKGALGMIGQTNDQGEVEVEVEEKQEVVEEEIKEEQEKEIEGENKKEELMKEELSISEEEIGKEEIIEEENQEGSLVEEKETDLKIKIEPNEDQSEIKPEPKAETKKEFKIDLSNTEDLKIKEGEEPDNQLNLELNLDKKTEESRSEDNLKTEDGENREIPEKETLDYKEGLSLKELPIEMKKIQENENSIKEENSNLDDLEKEQIEDEAKILEENRIDNAVIQGEELDLSNELEKMEDGEKGDDKK